MTARPRPEAYLDTALAALSTGPGWRASLDALTVPIYMTDRNGSVTYWNRACVDFAGREPKLGRDRWCVTWQIYTMAGERVPHSRCPMADAIRDRRPVRDVVAIALRPDGSRRAFKPYPTPLFDETGQMTGAINMLIDVSEEQSIGLQVQSDRCRRLAESSTDRWTAKVLGDMADGFERTASDLRKNQPKA